MLTRKNRGATLCKTNLIWAALGANTGLRREAMLIMVFTKAHHYHLFWARWIQSTSSHPTSFEIHFSITLTYAYILPLKHACHITRPSYPPWFDHLNNTCHEVQVMKFFILQLSPFSTFILLLRPGIIPLSTVFPNTLSPCSSLNAVVFNLGYAKTP